MAFKDKNFPWGRELDTVNTYDVSNKLDQSYKILIEDKEYKDAVEA